MKTINLDKWSWFSFKYSWGFKYGDHLIHFNIIYLSKGDTSKSTIEKTARNIIWKQVEAEWLCHLHGCIPVCWVQGEKTWTCWIHSRDFSEKQMGFQSNGFPSCFVELPLFVQYVALQAPVAFLSVASDPYEIKGQWQVQKPPRLLSLPEGRPILTKHWLWRCRCLMMFGHLQNQGASSVMIFDLVCFIFLRT